MIKRHEPTEVNVNGGFFDEGQTEAVDLHKKKATENRFMNHKMGFNVDDSKRKEEIEDNFLKSPSDPFKGFKYEDSFQDDSINKGSKLKRENNDRSFQNKSIEMNEILVTRTYERARVKPLFDEIQHTTLKRDTVNSPKSRVNTTSKQESNSNRSNLAQFYFDNNSKVSGQNDHKDHRFLDSNERYNQQVVLSKEDKCTSTIKQASSIVINKVIEYNVQYPVLIPIEEVKYLSEKYHKQQMQRLSQDNTEKSEELERIITTLKEENKALTNHLKSTTLSGSKLNRPFIESRSPSKVDAELLLERKEKEMYRAKYEQLYEKCKRDRLDEKYRRDVADTEGLSDMVKINEQLLLDKRQILERLEEEIEKNREISVYKIEIENHKKELSKLRKLFSDHLTEFSRQSKIPTSGERSRVESSNSNSRYQKQSEVVLKLGSKVNMVNKDISLGSINFGKHKNVFASSGGNDTFQNQNRSEKNEYGVDLLDDDNRRSSLRSNIVGEEVHGMNHGGSYKKKQEMIPQFDGLASFFTSGVEKPTKSRTYNSSLYEDIIKRNKNLSKIEPKDTFETYQHEKEKVKLFTESDKNVNIYNTSGKAIKQKNDLSYSSQESGGIKHGYLESKNYFPTKLQNKKTVPYDNLGLKTNANSKTGNINDTIQRLLTDKNKQGTKKSNPAKIKDDQSKTISIV